MDKTLTLSLEVLGASLIFPCSIGNLSRTGASDSHGEWVGSLALPLPGSVPGRPAPAAVLAPHHQPRASRLYVVATLGCLTHCSLTPHGGSCPHSVCGNHQSVSSHSIFHSFLTYSHRRTDGHLPTWDGCGRGGANGATTFSPGPAVLVKTLLL